MRFTNDRVKDGVRFNGNANKLRVPTFSVIHALQQFDPSVQIEATFAAAVILAETIGLDPHELVSRTRRQLSDLEAVRTANIDAVREYAAGELK